MARPLQLLLSFGLTFYALSHMNRIFDRGWERRARTQPCILFVALLTRARRGREQRREQRERAEAVKLRERLLRELAAHEGSLGHH